MCDGYTAFMLLGGRKKMDLDKQCVQIAAIAGLTILGSVSIIFDGDIGMTIAIGVAGALGFLARSLFGGAKDEKEVQE